MASCRTPFFAEDVTSAQLARGHRATQNELSIYRMIQEHISALLGFDTPCGRRG